MAHLGVLPTTNLYLEDVHSIHVEINSGNFAAYPHRFKVQETVFNSMMSIPGMLDRNASVTTYPYTMSVGFRPSIGNRGHRGRNTKSIRGLAQSANALGIARNVYAFTTDLSGDRPAYFLGKTTSVSGTGVFDLRVPDDQPVKIFMEPNTGEAKNAVVLEDILPVDPV